MIQPPLLGVVKAASAVSARTLTWRGPAVPRSCSMLSVDMAVRQRPLIRSILGSLARNVRAVPLLRLLELGAMASSSALASEAVCLNASRILAGRDRGGERQNHNADPGHRCRPFQSGSRKQPG
jgi:hypothetical protein